MKLSRREMLRMAGQAAIAGALWPETCLGKKYASPRQGVVTGDPDGDGVGARMLADGGNAIDAVITAALATCVVAPSKCGICGYGGSMTIAAAGGKKLVSIDYNTVAPAAARADMYPLNDKGAVIGAINSVGWLAAGVPGTLAGMQLALDRYGTRTFSEVAAPAIALARDGFKVSRGLAGAMRSARPLLKKYPASAKTFLKDGEPYREGDVCRNPELAQVLETLASRNSVASFYHGDLAARLAEEFKKNGGLVTEQDLAGYRALEVRPVSLDWNGFTIHTAPLGSGGLTILEAISILKATNWPRGVSGPARSHARLEALRVAWRDRLELFGDPEKVKVPQRELLSSSYARKYAREIDAAVKEGKPLPLVVKKELDDGTMSLSAVDGQGNMVAMTLTQGSAFGSKATPEGFGGALGHGMYRFDPHPHRPNSPGPLKRPLHNMCPTVVTHKGQALMAVGGAGGRMIPNAIYGVLTDVIGLEMTMEQAVAGPQLSNEGNLNLLIEEGWPAAEVEFFKGLGYKVTRAPHLANVSAVTFDARTGECRGAAC